MYELRVLPRPGDASRGAGERRPVIRDGGRRAPLDPPFWTVFEEREKREREKKTFRSLAPFTTFLYFLLALIAHYGCETPLASVFDKY